jgi:hypothetical protein
VLALTFKSRLRQTKVTGLTVFGGLKAPNPACVPLVNLSF